jgi:CRISPR-associated protein Cst2
MNKKGLTITIIFDAMSLNYGEGLGNISELKKLTKHDKLFSYMSRQAIRYNIYKILVDMFNITRDKANPLTANNTVIQFKPESNIKDYAELDLFGYMKTKKKDKSKSKKENEDPQDTNETGSATRSAIVRISPAVSLENMLVDIEFGSNKNFADRLSINPNPFQFEHHSSLYSYTVTIDLDKIGIDENDNIEINNIEKIKRVNMVLETIKILNREIKGRIENLNPLFIIGGIYDIYNPFFLGRIDVNYNNNIKKYDINTDILISTAHMTFNDKNIKNDTMIGYVKGYFANEDAFKNITDNIYDINGFFGNLEKKVNDYYGE